jgi:hypothetical protein
MAFLDGAGVPEIPAISKGSIDGVFCIANVFMPMRYWRVLQQIHDDGARISAYPTTRS